MVAVFFLDKLAIHAEVFGKLLVGGTKNIIIDLVHPDVALLHRLLAHKAGAAGSILARIPALRGLTALLDEGDGDIVAPEIGERDDSVLQRAVAFQAVSGQLQGAVALERPLDVSRVAAQTEHALAAAFEFNIALAFIIDLVQAEPLVAVGGEFCADIFAEVGVGGVSAVLTAAGGKGEHQHQCQRKRYKLFHIILLIILTMVPLSRLQRRHYAF